MEKFKYNIIILTIMNLPKIKKKVGMFLSNEEGKISKKAVVSLSLIAATTLFATSVSAVETSDWTANYEENFIRHANHSSY